MGKKCSFFFFGRSGGGWCVVVDRCMLSQSPGTFELCDYFSWTAYSAFVGDPSCSLVLDQRRSKNTRRLRWATRVVRSSRSCDSRKTGNWSVWTSPSVVRLIPRRAGSISPRYGAKTILEGKHSPVCKPPQKKIPPNKRLTYTPRPIIIITLNWVYVRSVFVLQVWNSWTRDA